MKQNHYKIVGVVVLVLMGLFFFTHKNWIAYLAFSIGVLSYSFEWFAKQFADKWMKFGKFLGDINATILLTFFFMVFLLPLSILRRFFVKKETLNSTWINVKEEKINFNKPW